MSTQHILFCQVVHPWKVISTLIHFHILEERDGNGTVTPCQVPVAVFSPRQMVLENVLSDLLDHIIVGVPRIHHDLARVFGLDAGLPVEGLFAAEFLIIIFVNLIVPFVR